MSREGIIRKLEWSIEPSVIQSTADEAILEAKQELDVILKNSIGAESLATLQAFEEVLGHLEEKLVPSIFLKYVSTDKAQRDTADDVEKQVQKFSNEIWGRKDLYDVIVKLESSIGTFGVEEQTLLKRTLDEFKHRGAALEEDARKEFLEISNNITVLESDYNRSLNEVTTTIPFTEEELDGIPSDIYEGLEREGDSYRLTLDYPVYNSVRRYARNPETRKVMEIAFSNRGGKKNNERFSDAIALRDRLSKLAGFSNFADYQISMKMAKTSKRVFEFLNDLKEKLFPLGDRELKTLGQLKAKEMNLSQDDITLDLWDLYYYHEMHLKEKYSIDQNEIKKYFPMDRVVAGVLEVYQKVLNLKFIESKNPNAWHEDVREFKVVDAVTKETKGVFYLDLFPRDGKYKHFAVFDIFNRRIKDGNALLPIAAMVANFQKPSIKQPSLLMHSEVETFFHEFGHLMHVISNSASYASFGLNGILPDFIETPSMMFQNWVWKEEVLSFLSGHYKDPTKKLPPELLRKLVEAKLLDIGLFELRQVFFSLIDMIYHTEVPEDVSSVWFEKYAEIALLSYPETTHPASSFGHLMGGYEAGYYGYLWSQVYAEDIFTRFEKNGFMDEKTGYEYRLKILAPGGSREPDDLVRDFLGRESNSDAFMKSLGIDKQE